MNSSDQIPYIISSLRFAVYRFIERELKEHGIGGLVYTHGAVLYALYQNGGSMRLSDIARLINRTKPTVTVLVDRLEKCGYVRRQQSGSDSRVTIIEVTERGNSLRKVFTDAGQKLRQKAFRGIGRNEQELLVELLQRVANNLAGE